MKQWVPAALLFATAASLAAGQTGLVPSRLAAPGAIPPTAVSSAAAAPIASAPVAPPAVPARTFHDPTWKISFDYPANWTFSRKDREISTFHLDARSAPRASSLRAVAAIPENPFPASTFSGAYVYLSVTPKSTDAACARQAVPTPAAASGATVAASARPSVREIAGIVFAHGHDEQRHICTTDRDEIYTTFHHGACYRFDLAINNFCGGEVSGVKDITQKELDQVRARMEAILATVRFDTK
jgi:hypothetical protein